MVDRVEEYRWSSAGVHLSGAKDSSGILDLEFWEAAGGAERWQDLHVAAKRPCETHLVRRCTYAGRPFGEGRSWRGLGPLFRGNGGGGALRRCREVGADWCFRAKCEVFDTGCPHGSYGLSHGFYGFRAKSLSVFAMCPENKQRPGVICRNARNGPPTTKKWRAAPAFRFYLHRIIEHGLCQTNRYRYSPLCIKS